MASVKDFVPTPDELKGQKLGGEKMAETAFSKTPQPAAPKQTGGATAKVSSFTPTAEEIAAQQYDTVGAKGRQPGMQTLAAKERIVASGGAARPSTVAEVSAPELKASMQRGVEPMSKLQFATDTPASKLQIPAVQGEPKTTGIFGAKPTAIRGATPAQRVIESATGVGRSAGVQPMSMDDVRLQETMGEAKKAGAERVAKARMGVGAVEPAVTQVVDTTIPKYASEAARANAMGTATGLAGSVIQSPEIAAQTNEALRRRGLKGIIPQQGGEEMLTTQFGRWLGGKAYDVMNPAVEQKPSAVAPQPATPASVVAPQTPATEQPKLLSTQAEAVPVGGTLTGGATVGTQEPVVDFSKKPATVPLAQGQTEMQRGTEIETAAREKGQAVSKGAGGNFRYVQGPDGKIVKQNTDSGEVVPMSVQGITGNILKPGEESPLAREARTRKETAFRDALVRQAFQPIDANTNVADVGTIKRNKAVAQQLLEQLDRSQQAGAQLGLEEKKLASTERATAATQEQNRIAKEAEQRIRERQAAATEKQADIAAQAEERKASEKTYLVDGKAVKMTEDRYKQYQTEKTRDQFLKAKTKKEGLSPEEAEAEYATVVAAQSQVAKALADPKNADKRDAIKAAYRKATGLDYIE